LQVCSPPRSSLPLRIPPQGSRGFYVRAYRAPSHAPDMLAVRIQAIDGTGTFTLSDSQPCRLLLAPPSSLLRAHVPLPWGSLLLRHLASFEESWQVVRSPCCPRELPDVISENLSLDAGSRTPAVHRVLSPVSSTMSSAFPKQRMGRLLAGGVSRMQIFLNVPASKFALPPDRSYRCDTAAGQPGILRPGLSCFVTSTRTGYANRPSTGN